MNPTPTSINWVVVGIWATLGYVFFGSTGAILAGGFDVAAQAEIIKLLNPGTSCPTGYTYMGGGLCCSGGSCVAST